MNPDARRFWPQDPGQQPEGPQPGDLLRAAAAELGPATKFEVVVDLRTHASNESLVHEFYLVSETVGYRYLLFRARHVLGFPVTIFDGPEGTSAEDDVECESAQDLEEVLKQLFEHPVTQRIVGQLRNLSREAG
ncbi:MAG: hypothetical protein R6X02_02590 [Enhygromyxa sp.]